MSQVLPPLPWDLLGHRLQELYNGLVVELGVAQPEARVALASIIVYRVPEGSRRADLEYVLSINESGVMLPAEPRTVNSTVDLRNGDATQTMSDDDSDNDMDSDIKVVFPVLDYFYKLLSEDLSSLPSNPRFVPGTFTIIRKASGKTTCGGTYCGYCKKYDEMYTIRKYGENCEKIRCTNPC